ncbi:MAG: hypothetical protein RRB22_02190 [Gammaproteobacteria bacterium]|nr:hypothetical protein [Gammaproteobacteria bacterium]
MRTESHPSCAESEGIPGSRGFGVAASPFNGIKIELGFAILLGAIVWLAADSITANAQTQWLILLGYGLTSMAWLVLRTRAVLRRCLARAQVCP